MRMHLELDKQLIEEVQRLGHFPTKKAAVTSALHEYAKLLKRQQLLKLRDKIS